MIILPHVGFNVAVEVGLLGDAVALQELTDVRFDIGGDGTGTIAITVVACVGEPTHQIVFDDALLPAWHVVVEPGEADGHPTDLVAAIHGTLCGLCLWMLQIDAVRYKTVLGDIGCHQRMETMLHEWTMFRKAGQVGSGFLPEDLFSFFHFCFDIFVQI